MHEGGQERRCANSSSDNFRLWIMKETNICVPHSCICAARYGSSTMEDVLANATSFRQPCDLKDIVLPSGNTFSCHESCTIPRQVPLSILISF
jgi:hypothetical protein